MLITGDANVGQRRGIALNASDVTIANSDIRDIKDVGLDSQAICGWNTPGRITIRNNYLEAAGENIMFGGADIKIPNLVPSDIVVEDNILTNPKWRGTSWTVKNLFELKNARRVLVRRNLMEYNWSGGQAGFAIVLTPRNSSGRTPWVVVEDVEFSNNVIRSASSVFNILGHDDTARSGQLARLLIKNNLAYDIHAGNWGGTGTFRAARRRAAQHHHRPQHSAAHRPHRALLLRQLHQRQRRAGGGRANRRLRVHEQHGQTQRVWDFRQRPEHWPSLAAALCARVRRAQERARERQGGRLALSAGQFLPHPRGIHRRVRGPVDALSFVCAWSPYVATGADGKDIGCAFPN